MVMLVTAQIFVLSGIIATIGATTPELKNCTEAEKIYYGTYKFAVCDMKQYLNWCKKGQHTWYKTRAQVFKDLDPDYTDSSNCSRYSTSCDYLRFLTKVCGANYKVCHTDQERKIIIKMWIKQFIRETVFQVDKFEDDSLELKNGKCNDILKEFFDDKEINEISDMIGTPDNKYKFFNNVTLLPMGVLAKKDGSGRMPLPEEITNITKYDHMTIPSHWKYCDWKLTHEFKHRTDFDEFPNLLPDFWHCDGKCNTNKGYDQAWYLTQGGFAGRYIDLNNGEYKKEGYMNDLILESDFQKNGENSSDKGVFGCHMDTEIDFVNDDCQKYQNFVKYCLDPIEKCLGNIAIREVVLYATVQDFKPYKCWEKASSSNYVMSTLILTLLCILFNKVI